MTFLNENTYFLEQITLWFFLVVHGLKCTWHATWLVFTTVLVLLGDQLIVFLQKYMGIHACVGTLYIQTHRKSKHISFQNDFLIAVLNCNVFVSEQSWWDRESLEKICYKFSENAAMYKSNDIKFTTYKGLKTVPNNINTWKN